MTSEQTEPSSPVRVEVADGVATVTLADEANRNAMGRRMVAGLLDALAAANADPAVRVVVLTNEGRIFSAGADLSEQSAGGDPAGSEDEPGGEAAAGRGFEDLLRAILDSPTPVVGRIDGHAVGGGVGLVAACDIAIARDDVLLGFTEVRVGVIPAMISVVCLPKMRRADALEVFLRGNRFPASRAAELGLVTRAVPAGELDDAVAEVVADLRLGAPRALAEAKRLVYEVPGMPVDEALRDTAERSARLFAGEEAAEGMAAFLAKRRPAWAPPGD